LQSEENLAKKNTFHGKEAATIAMKANVKQLILDITLLGMKT
jgi:ribonuclease BN (tRNA processing enzyme)